MVNGNQALVEGAYEAFGRGDIPAVLGILSDDVEWDVPDVLPQEQLFSDQNSTAKASLLPRGSFT